MPQDFGLTFQNGSLLTGEMLTLLYREPQRMERLLFADYADGVVSGMRLSVNNGKLKIGAGLYLYRGRLFRQDDEYEISPLQEAGGICAFEDGYDYEVYPELKEIRQTANIVEQRLDFIAYKQGGHPPKSAPPLFSFYGRPHLPTQFKHLFERSFRLLSAPYSAYGEPTFLPQVFELILHEIRSKPRKHPLDYLLMNHILSNGIIPCGILRLYIHEAGLSLGGKPDTRENLMLLFGEAMKKLHWEPSAQTAEELQVKSSQRRESLWV